MHAYTVPESLVPGHLHPNTQRKYREVLRKFQVTQETTWPDVLAAVNATASKTNRSQRARAFDPGVRFARSRLTPLPPRTAAVGGPQEPTTATLAPQGSLALLKNKAPWGSVASLRRN